MVKAKSFCLTKLFEKKSLKIISTTSVLLFMTSFQSNLLAGTLQEAAVQTLRSNPVVLASQAAERRSKHAISAARAGYFPTLDISGEAGSGKVENSTTRARALVEEGTSDDQNNNPYGYTVRLSQELFTGFSTIYEMQSAKLRRKAAQNDYLATSISYILKFRV
jgi:outer membrane protein TolC